ncbi:hypothetical protein IFM89_037870 [Coptis chinensis]|uniref:Transcription factor 25 n=1 Tax=Coptis chinensis TaxID=261450 RepID=A0A835HSE7_9MAGN|nr:hypothetical protein IFM89_037870 [Coptis chinensis]
MSARYLKKVLKEQEEQQQLLKSDSQQLNDVHDDSDSSPPRTNPFQLLLDDDDDQPDELENADEPVQMKSTAQTLPPPNRKSKKKKKKGKDGSNSTKDTSGKSIDEILHSLSMDAKSSSRQDASTNAKAENTRAPSNLMKQQTSSILYVDPKFLRPESELRRIFGSDVVRSFESSSSSGSSRQVRGGRRGGHIPRKTFLVSPSAHWPRWDGSLSMELLETKNGQHFFKYVHTSSYSQAQRAFEAAKAIHDLNGIASILVYHPYHIESLITIAEVLKFSGEHQSSADAIAKCLYALECAWHPMFSPMHGSCQLKYSHDTNRPLFSVLFTHMQNMDRRGCHRSALEVCKLLLSLDPEDPMGAMFCIDYFSLRAEEYSWLERFSEEYRSDNSLWLFPNFSYSLAICRFYLERESCTDSTPEENEKSTSSDLMKQALMLHPLVLKKLVAKAPLKDPAWTKILMHKFFGSAQAGGPSLEHLIEIYVERSYILWRLPDLQILLRDTAQLVTETLQRDGSDAKDWACVRKETFSSERNEYSHLLVSEFSNSVPTMPPDELRDFMIDPRMAQAVVGDGDHGANPEVAARAPREVMNRNGLVVFLESILPWVDYGENEDNHLDGNNRDED